jgi:hypothetical protein
MPTLEAAARDAQLGYVSVKRRNAYTSDVEAIQAAAVVGGCTCKGECGSHVGACSMKAGTKDGKAMTQCKACDMAMSMKSKKMKAGGPGSGRHALLDAVKAHLLSKGFKLDTRGSSPDGRYTSFSHPNPELSTEIKQHVKSLGFVNTDGRKYGPSGNQHENFDHPETVKDFAQGKFGKEHTGNSDTVQVAKYKDGRGGGSRGTSVTLMRSGED